MIFSYLFGTLRLYFTTSSAPTVFALLAKREIPFTDSKTNGEICTLRIPLYKKSEIKSLEGIVKSEICGFPKTLYKYRKRWGIAMGALLFSLIVYFSGTVIWTIEVTGNKAVSDDYIKSVLSKVGCGVGTKIKNLDFDEINNKFLIESDGIAWISVNMNGTHANAEVREVRKGKDASQSPILYNLVAGEDGQIQSVAAYEGKPLVKINDAVSKGDLLVSGVITHKETNLRFESAEGKVFAKVNRSFDIKIPFECEKKVYTGEKTTDRTVTFFKNRINLFPNSRNSKGFYDIIEDEKKFAAGGFYLPLSVNYTTYAEYVPKKSRLSQKEAENLLLAQYRKMLVQTLGDGELLSKTVKRSESEEALCLHCDMYCLADIAVKKEIKIN